MTVKYTNNLEKYIKNLKLAAGQMQESAAAALNRGISLMERDYRRTLEREFTLRNKFTLGAIKVFKATPRRSSGELRALQNINAVLGVRKMKGGKEHYLLFQEEGARKKGVSITSGKVPIPLTAARTGGSYNKPIGGRYRLFKNNIQTLVVDRGIRKGARRVTNFGVNDGFSPHQRWAIALKYAASTTKTFTMETVRGIGMFAMQKGKLMQVRTLSRSSVNIKPRHYFERAFKAVTPELVRNYFDFEARKRVRK